MSEETQEALVFHSPGAPITARVLEPRPEALHEAGRLRIRELKSISNRLGRMGKRQYDRAFSAAALLLLGGVVGGGFGLVPFLSTNPSPSHPARVYYFGLLSFAFILGVACTLARFAIKSEREDS